MTPFHRISVALMFARSGFAMVRCFIWFGTRRTGIGLVMVKGEMRYADEGQG